MNRRFRVLAVAIALLVAALVLTASLAGAASGGRQSDPAANAGVVSLQATAAEQSAAASHWTRAARLAAKPLDVSGVTAEQLAAGLAAMDAAAPSGPAGFAPGSLPSAGADASAQQDFAADWAAAETDAAAAAANPALLAPSGTAGVFDWYYTNFYTQMWKFYPWKAIGKLFFNAGFCSASVIGPDTIVTAAHCVFNTDNNTWYTNWSFCPAYRNGNCPYGTYAWQQAWVLTTFVNSPSWAAAIRYDVAIIQLRTNAAGQHIQNLTGTLGRSWNFGYTQLIHTIGYPAAKSNGQYQYLCVAETFQAGTDIMEMGCNSGPGHSGGPWIKDYRPYNAGAMNYVNNVMSYYYTGGSKAGNTMGAARFSSNNIVILCNAAPGC